MHFLQAKPKLNFRLETATIYVVFFSSDFYGGGRMFAIYRGDQQCSSTSDEETKAYL